MNKYGNRLRELREKNQYTQEALAKLLGTSRSRIAMYERGERQPDFEMQETIADFFNVTIDYLFGREPEVLKDENGQTIYLDTVKKALELYQSYMRANSDIQQAVGLLLKQTQPLADTAKKMKENMVPYLEGMQLDVELLRKKKDKDQ